jgi:hypothetical protein
VGVSDNWKWGGMRRRCGHDQNVHHVFFNCHPIFRRGFDHLKIFQGLVVGEKKVKEMLGVIWFANIFVI